MSRNKLINRKNKSQLVKELKNEPFKRKTCSFYRYVNIKDPQYMRDTLLEEWLKYKILGRVYVAKEGINAQISIPEFYWHEYIESLNKHNEFTSIHIKNALYEHNYSFIKLIIRVKNKLVADGINELEYNLNNVGKHLDAKEFNDAIEDSSSIVVDMRNYYESEVGHFDRAICPDVATFKEALPAVKKELKNNKYSKILLYCTGGIRCEKASAYLKHHGFKDVNQLNGGIIEYAHQIKKNKIKSKFIGKNFVFDNRMNEAITNDIISYCHQCDRPSSNHTNCNNQACHMLFIQCKKCDENYAGCCSEECNIIASLPIDQQRELRKIPKIAAPLKQYQKSIKPRLKDLIRERNKVKQIIY